MKPDKRIRLDGRFCTLAPITEGDLSLVVELRNRRKNKYFLNQKYDITLEMQTCWYREYLERENDIYWGIWKTGHIFIGTIRLYNMEGDTCEEGSCIVDEKYAKEAPYAVEAKYLLAMYAFRTLGMRRMINEIRVDNKVMNALAKQQGYQLVRVIEIGGEPYYYMVLDADQFAGDKMKRLLDYWGMRDV